MGPAPFQLNGGHGEASAAVHKAAAVGESVTNELAVSVKGDQVECSRNGAVVATCPNAEVLTTAKLKSTDGAWGIRFAHNTDVTVTMPVITKQPIAIAITVMSRPVAAPLAASATRPPSEPGHPCHGLRPRSGRRATIRYHA